jgi:hypothetical protein
VGKFTVSLTPVANLPPVPLIPAVHREYLREFSKKLEMILMLFSGALAQEKSLKQKKFSRLSL